MLKSSTRGTHGHTDKCYWMYYRTQCEGAETVIIDIYIYIVVKDITFDLVYKLLLNDNAILNSIT